jgi:autotransporter-associated beta strand protein
LTLQGSTAGTGEFAGVIANQNSGNLTAVTKSGTGTWNLSGANSYTGATTVTAGTLLINGSTNSGSAVTVQSAGTLGGNGTVGGTVSVSGKIAAGNSIGTLSTGALTLTSTGTLDNELGRSGVTPVSDLVVVTGSVTLDNNLQLTLYGGLNNPVENDLFFLINNDGADAISGVFTKLNTVTTTLTQGSQFTWNSQQWKISYTADYAGQTFTGGNDLALQVVPEPSTWLLLGLGLTTMIVFRHRRQG